MPYRPGTPSGLVPFPFRAHGSRRGLHSYAASRLKSVVEASKTLEALVLGSGIPQRLKPELISRA